MKLKTAEKLPQHLDLIGVKFDVKNLRNASDETIPVQVQDQVRDPRPHRLIDPIEDIDADVPIPPAVLVQVLVDQVKVSEDNCEHIEKRDAKRRPIGRKT